jgi:hypothetical protein
MIDKSGVEPSLAGQESTKLKTSVVCPGLHQRLEGVDESLVIQEQVTPRLSSPTQGSREVSGCVE